MAGKTYVGWASSKTVVAGSNHASEVSAYLDWPTENQYVIVGFGAKIKDNNFTLIQLTIAPLLSDGSIGPSKVVKYGDQSAEPQLEITLPAGEVMVGLGLRAHDRKMGTLWVYSRRLDPQQGLLPGSLKRYESDQKGYKPEVEFLIADDEPGVNTLTITGVGARCNKDSNVTTMVIHVATLQQFLMPVFRQPGIDVAANPVSRVYVDSTYPAKLRYRVVLAGEDAYSASTGQKSVAGSAIYASLSYDCWGRTADLESIYIEYDDAGEPTALSYGSYAGDQSFFKGAKGTVESYFNSYALNFIESALQSVGITGFESLLSVPVFDDGLSTDPVSWDEVEKTADGRPVVYINTSNHLFGTRNNNPDMPLTEAGRYEVAQDYWITSPNEDAAEEYAKSLPTRDDRTLSDKLKLLVGVVWKC